jgi:hypothetical protein
VTARSRRASLPRVISPRHSWTPRLVLSAVALTLTAGCAGGGQDVAEPAPPADTAQSEAPRAASLSFHPVLGPGDPAALTPADEVDPTRELSGAS